VVIDRIQFRLRLRPVTYRNREEGLEMKEIGIKEMARLVEEFAEAHLMTEKCCAAVIDNDIVLCVKMNMLIS
jgi:hypothetical protein